MEVASLTLQQQETIERAETGIAELEASHPPVVVNDDASYARAGESFAVVKKAMKSLDVERRELVDPLNEVVGKINARYKGFVARLEAELDRFKVPMEGYQRKLLLERQEAERKAREEEARLKREADERAERARQEMRDRQRQADELSAAAAAAAEEDPLAAVLLQEEAAEAERAAKESYGEAKTAIVESATVSVAVAAPPKPVVAGTAARFPWKHKVVDPALVPREFLVVDEAKLARHAKEHKDLAKVPGVEFYQDVSVGGGR